MLHESRGKRWFRWLFALGVILTLGGWRSGEAFFAPDAELWPRWEAHDASGPAKLDFSDWSAWLDRFVVPRPKGNRVAYHRATQDGQRALDAIIADLEATRISNYNRDQQLAYWINLYNAVMVQVVLDHYPVDSPREIDISPGLFADGPWGRKLVTVEGEELSLDDIEHRILRPIWQDPRIHYAVNCAAIGCPDLRAEAYRAEDIDTQLDAQARAYVNDPRGVSVSNGKITVSKIYDWFIEDFGGTEDLVLDHLSRYAELELSEELSHIDKISDVAYDWSLNDLP